MINFNGNITLQKANEPKNQDPYSWKTTEPTKEPVHVQFRVDGYNDEATGDEDTQQARLWEYDVVGAWAVCAWLDDKSGTVREKDPRVNIYVAAPEGENTVTIIDQHTEYEINNKNVLKDNPADVSVSATLKSPMIVGAISLNWSQSQRGTATIAGGIPIFREQSAALAYIKGEKALGTDVPTNGVENNEDVPAGGVREIIMAYSQWDIGDDVHVPGMSSTLFPIYREGVYAIPISSKTTTVYCPVEVGYSVIGFNVIGSKWRIFTSGGTYTMQDSNGPSEIFPGTVSSAYAMHKDSSDAENGDYHCVVYGNGIGDESAMPAMSIPNSGYDIVGSTFTSSAPMFDSHEKLVKYLLGEIDEDEAIPNPIDNNTETIDNDTPTQDMIVGNGVNFTC